MSDHRADKLGERWDVYNAQRKKNVRAGAIYVGNNYNLGITIW